MDIMFGTKVYDTKKKQIAILLKTYNLGYVDNPDAMGAYVIGPDLKRYPQRMDYLIFLKDVVDEEIQELNIPEFFLAG